MRKTSLVALLVAGALFVPLAVFASHRFNDVPDDQTFHNAIAWMKDNNITVGCNPPANTNYCPDDFVTRGQMAAFMKRLAENNVVDAATLDGLDANSLVRAEGSASSDGLADTVTIEAPVDGFLVVNAVAESGDPPGALWSCSIDLDGTFAPTDFNITVNDLACPYSVVLPVDAGEHTVDIVADTNLASSSLSVLFVPFDGSGE